MKQLIIHRRVLLVLFLIMLLTLERRGFTLSFSARTLSSLLSIQTDLSCYLYTLVKTYPHDTRAFSQGLLFHEGALYESTGLYGHSSLRKIDLNTGKILKIAPLSSPYFGEGLTLLGNTLYQLTWQSGMGFRYDLITFKITGFFHYNFEGWGITNDGHYLIISDGTATLRFIDPGTFSEIKRITVQAGGQEIPWLNELEYIEGEIFANVWQSDIILRINPQNGHVSGWIDLSCLHPDRSPQEDVLNGIAYDSKQRHLFVTGKNWPLVYEITIQKK